mmetsp:Transcript_14785/g.37599  ORF Transcript_14785/g.37599 Transcript_14785/m.37599 type:complete len:83 (+) Transcript_14785:465-713(+)
MLEQPQLKLPKKKKRKRKIENLMAKLKKKSKRLAESSASDDEGYPGYGQETVKLGIQVCHGPSCSKRGGRQIYQKLESMTIR